MPGDDATDWWAACSSSVPWAKCSRPFARTSKAYVSLHSYPWPLLVTCNTSHDTHAPHDTHTPTPHAFLPNWLRWCSVVQIEQILKTLNASLLQKDKALNEFKVQHKIRVMGEDEDEAPAPQAKSSSSSSSGVLV